MIDSFTHHPGRRALPPLCCPVSLEARNGPGLVDTRSPVYLLFSLRLRGRGTWASPWPPTNPLAQARRRATLGRDRGSRRKRPYGRVRDGSRAGKGIEGVEAVSKRNRTPLGGSTSKCGLRYDTRHNSFGTTKGPKSKLTRSCLQRVNVKATCQRHDGLVRERSMNPRARHKVVLGILGAFDDRTVVS